MYLLWLRLGNTVLTFVVPVALETLVLVLTGHKVFVLLKCNLKQPFSSLGEPNNSVQHFFPREADLPYFGFDFFFWYKKRICPYLRFCVLTGYQYKPISV